MHNTEKMFLERRHKDAVERAKNSLAHWKAHYERCRERGYSAAVLERVAQIVTDHQEDLVAAEASLQQFLQSGDQ